MERKNLNPLETLKSDFGVEAKKHPELDLYILDYSQKDSPRFNPIVDECRGLVIDGNYDLVSKGFSRFYNLGEGPDVIDWSQPVHVTTKQDGSMIHTFHHKDQWFVNTRFSWGDGEVNLSGFTWRQLVEKHLDYSKLNKKNTYVFELCGPYNKVVRQYPPSLFLLAFFAQGEEYPHWCIQYESERIGIPATETHNVKSQDEAIKLLEKLSAGDPTFEGFVFRDWKDDRCKSKNASYVALHQMSSNGCIGAYKHIVPLVIKNEHKEVLVYFPEIEERVKEVEKAIANVKKETDNIWFCHHDCKSQKDFALIIQKETKYTWPLFQARKTGKHPWEFIDSDYILKTCYRLEMI